MVVVTVLFAILAIAAVVAAVVGFSRANRAETEVADGSKRVGELVERVGELESTVKERDDELTRVSGELEAARKEVASAAERQDAARKEADERSARADAAEAEVTQLAGRVEKLQAEVMAVTEAKVAADARADALAAAAEQAATDQASAEKPTAKKATAKKATPTKAAADAVTADQPAPSVGEDGAVAASPEALWRLELARSERLWRNSVAVVPDETSPIATADDALVAALEIELAAAREDSGVEVELEIDLPRRLQPAEALAVLRAAQELLPVAVRAGHATTLWVAAAGDDVIVEVSSLDDEGTPIEIDVPDLPPGRLVGQTGGIRLVGFLA